MSFSIAAPTFVSGALDELATSDVYKLRTNTVINSIQDFTKLNDKELQAVLRGGAFLASQLPILQKVGVSGLLSINKDNLIARLGMSSGSLVAGIRNMGPGLASAIAANIPGASQVFASVNGITQQVSSSVLGSISDIGKTISDITKTSGMFSIDDRGATIGLLSGLVTEATRFGIPNSVDGLLKNISDPYVINRVVAQTLPLLVSRSDLASISAAARLVPTGSLGMAFPNLAQSFSRAYVAPQGTAVADYSRTYEQAIDAYSRADSNWDRAKRVGPGGVTDTILSVVGLQDASPSFRKVLDIGVKAAVGDNTKLYALASLFPSTTVDQQLARQHPLTVLGGTQRVTGKITDPRTLANLFL